MTNIDFNALSYDALCKLMADHPRLLAKFVDLVRDEHRDGNLSDVDIVNAWNGNWDDEANAKPWAFEADHRRG